MAKLILTMNTDVVGEYFLDRECLTIGRKSDNDIQIKDRAISGHHCQIITVLNDSFLEDLNSTNGTFVNSHRIDKQALRNGDVINLGIHQLKYINEFADRDTTASREGDSNVKQKQTEIFSTREVGSTAVDSSEEIPPRYRAWLEILNGSNKDKHYDLRRTMTTLGKPGSQVAVITNRGSYYVIIGIEADTSGQYPRLNGKPISGSSRRLSDKDVIDVGKIRMIFRSTN